MRLRLVKSTEGGQVGYMFECPGCGIAHIIDGRWTFNDDLSKPTFRPSLLVWWNEGEEKKRCHSYVTDGKIQFLSDSTHSLAGKTVSLPEVTS